MTFVAITGRPGVGKTTVFFKVINALRDCGVSICGFYCPEVREGSKRVGFKIVDLVSGEEGWLSISMDKASVLGIDGGRKRRVGRYVVLEEDAARIGVNALARCGNASLVAIDEIGPMELSVPTLRRAIVEVLSRASNAFLVIHRNLSDRDVLRILNARGTKIYVVNEGNRNELPKLIVDIFKPLCVTS